MENEFTEVSSSGNSDALSLLKTLAMSMGTAPTPGVFDDVSDSIKKITDAAKNSTPVRDGYSNPILSIGGDDRIAQYDQYGFSNDTLNWMLWLSLYQDSWVFKRAIDKPAQDSIRAGITVQGSFDKKDDIEREIKNARTDMIQLLEWGALFGGSICCVLFDGMEDEDYKEPLSYNLNKLKASHVFRYYVVDRWYGVSPTYNDTVTDMANIDFGKPRYYDVTMADGHTIRFHHDYVVRYEHRSAPKLVKNGMLQGWGYAEGSHILRELMRDDKLKSSIQSLVDKSLIEVIKMAGMRGIFLGADEANQQQLQKRLEMVNWGRNFNALTFLDKDDEYQMNNFSGLTGLSDILEQNLWMISSALEMQGVLFGDLKQGFSNDVDALERYDQTILGRCEDYVRPAYQKLLSIFYNKYGIQDKVEFEFNSLLAKKRESEKVQSLSSFSDLCIKLLDSGVIDLPQCGKALQNYTAKGIVDFDITDEKIEKLEQREKEEMENIDIGGV